MPIQPRDNLTVGIERWHQVYRPSWETLIGAGYVKNAGVHTYSLDVHGLANTDGQCSFFGGGAALGFDLQPWPDGNVKSFYIVSSSAGDFGDAIIYGIDGAGDMAMVTVSLNGATPVFISSTLQHINAVKYFGGNTGNTGALAVSTRSTAGIPDIVTDNIQVIMDAGWGYAVNPTMMAANGEVMVFPEINISADKNDGIEIEVWQGLKDGSGNLHRQKTTEWYLYQHAYQNHFGVPIVIGPGEWIRVTIERASGASTVNAACDLRHYGLYDDNTVLGASALFDQG